MRNLIPVFSEDRIPIIPTERDMMVRLMADRRMDPEPAEHFNVVDDPCGPSTAQGCDAVGRSGGGTNGSQRSEDRTRPAVVG